MKRGIVVGARVVSSSAGFSMNGALEKEDLLRWLLYWDEIVYAGLGLGGASITGNHPPDVSYLEAEGVFRRE